MTRDQLARLCLLQLAGLIFAGVVIAWLTCAYWLTAAKVADADRRHKETQREFDRFAEDVRADVRQRKADRERILGVQP